MSTSVRSSEYTCLRPLQERGFRRLSKFIDSHRVRDGAMASDSSLGMTGAFVLPSPCPHLNGDGVRLLNVVASDGDGWEHVSVSVNASLRTPSWEEMDYVRKLWWKNNVWVIQYHAPSYLHVNVHPGCLHMWRPTGKDIPVPPQYMV